MMTWTQRPIAASFVEKLRRSPGFGQADLAALASLAADMQTIEPNCAIVSEGSLGDRIHILLDGWAARVKILENGSRQIPSLMLPGDICDIDALQLERNNCGVVAITRCSVAIFSRDAMTALFDAHRGLRNAVYRMMAVDNAIATQWAVCLGRRSARERLAHMLCELHARLEAIGEARGGSYTLPLTQEELADLLGLTAVHVNRTLQGLRADGVIQLRDHRLTIPDAAELARVAGFDPSYLHLREAKAASAQDGASRVRSPASPAYLAH